MKICLVCSSGGHLTQLYNLHPWWKKYDRFWVTFKKPDTQSLLKDEIVYFAYYPTNRSVKNLLKNGWLAFKILIKSKPDLIVSTGAGVAVPFFYIGKLLGINLLYLEIFDRMDSPTLTGKLVYPIANRFLIQWEKQKLFYPRGRYWGQAL